MVSLSESLKQHPADIRAEVIAAGLAEEGVPLEDIAIRPAGAFERSYRKDVFALQAPDESSGHPYYVLHVSREGLYDALPPGVFHEPPDQDPFKPVEQMLKEIETQREEEAHARTFFSVLEAEFHRQRILIELAERKLLVASAHANNRRLFARLWGDAPFLTVQQQTLLLHLLPYSHRIAGNLGLTARCLELLLKEPVRIEYAESKGYPIPEAMWPRLGKTALGVSFALGKQLEDAIPALRVTIGPVSKAVLPGYLTRSAVQEKVLAYLYAYFLPVEAQVETRVTVHEAERNFTLGKAGQPNYLQHTTCL